MATPERIRLAADLAERLAGRDVRYSIDEPDGPAAAFVFGGLQWVPVTREGRIVGHSPELGSVVVVSSSPHASRTFPTDTVFTATIFTAKWTTAPRFQTVVPWDVVPPTKALIHIFPHVCPRCGGLALVLFRTVDCNNWRCDNWYLR